MLNYRAKFLCLFPALTFFTNLALSTEISGVVYDANTNSGKPGVFVTLKRDGNTISTGITDDNGAYSFTVNDVGEYELIFRKAAHRMIVPQTPLTVGSERASVKVIRAFDGSKPITPKIVEQVLRERAGKAEDFEKLVEADLNALEISDSFDPATLNKLRASLLGDSSKLHFAGRFPNISHDELKRAIEEKKVVLIDVNGTESYKAGHIPGAINFDEAKNDLAEKLPKDKDALIVTYVGNEYDPNANYKAAAEKARKLGYYNVKHYPKGIAGWKKAGEKAEKAH